jgi:hypothetical protein
MIDENTKSGGVAVSKGVHGNQQPPENMRLSKQSW